MKKALIVLVAIAVAIGFASTVFAAETKVTGKEKVKETPAGTQTTTKSKAVTKLPGQKLTVKITQHELNNVQNLTDNTVTIIKTNNAKLTMPVAKDPDLHNRLTNHVKSHKTKDVIISTYKIGPKEYVKDFELSTP